MPTAFTNVAFADLQRMTASDEPTIAKWNLQSKEAKARWRGNGAVIS
jgi:hypothetical protein